MSIPHFMPSCSTVIPRVWARFVPAVLAAIPSVITPTSCGPAEAPKSPPAAIIAYKKTPPVGMRSDAIIKLPGHNIDTQSPVNAQANNPSRGRLVKAAVK